MSKQLSRLEKLEQQAFGDVQTIAYVMRSTGETTEQAALRYRLEFPDFQGKLYVVCWGKD